MFGAGSYPFWFRNFRDRKSVTGTSRGVGSEPHASMFIYPAVSLFKPLSPLPSPTDGSDTLLVAARLPPSREKLSQSPGADVDGTAGR